MKTLNTNLSEKSFLDRLDSMCTKHKLFDKGYSQLNVFVVKKKAYHFRIGRHLKDIPSSRINGYHKEFIYGKYTVNETGKVEVKYRFSMPLSFFIPNLVICLINIPIFSFLLYDTIFNGIYHWGGLIVTFIFSFIGIFELFMYSQKQRVALEEHLLNICRVKDKGNEVKNEHS